MEATFRASASSSRFLLRPSSLCHTASVLVLSQRSLRPSPLAHHEPFSNRSQSRYLSSSIQKRGPESSLFSLTAGPGSPSSLAPGGAPHTYFSHRSSLPANTVIRFVPQQTAWIVERMGKFNRILEPGLAILIPFLDRIAYVKSLKESAIEIPSQNAITADNVTLELDGVLYTRVFDAYKARLVSPQSRARE
jgi:hypothetical protein